MDWVKTAMYASVIWFGISIAVGIGLARYVTTHPMGPEKDRMRTGKAGELAGSMAGVGIGVIWLGLYARSNLQSRRPKRQGRRRKSGGPRRDGG